jgi:predicted nucleic acid-binding protein
LHIGPTERETANRDYVLDAFGVIAMVFGEPGGLEVRDILGRAASGEIQVSISVVNWGEAMYIAERRRGLARAVETASDLDAVPVEVVPVDRVLAERAAHFKVRGRISYADCYAVALAELRRGVVVTGDPEFRAFENAVAIHWLPQRPRP